MHSFDLSLAINKTINGDQSKDRTGVIEILFFLKRKSLCFPPWPSSLVIRDPTHAMQVNYILLSKGQ